MTSALERASFLANSENRVAVLEALRRGPRDARDLREETGASRATVGRVLKAFENRAWVERRDGVYAVTPAGELAGEAFDALLERLETVATLETASDWLPVEEMGVDAAALDDAEVVRPSGENATAHLEYGRDLIREASRVVLVTDAVLPRYLEAIADGVRERDLTVRQVYPTDLLETVLADDRTGHRVRAALRAGEPVWRTERPVPANFMLVDGTVVFFACNDAAVPEGLLVTGADGVREWALASFERLRDERVAAEPDRRARLSPPN